MWAHHTELRITMQSFQDLHKGNCCKRAYINLLKPNGQNPCLLAKRNNLKPACVVNVLPTNHEESKRTIVLPSLTHMPGWPWSEMLWNITRCPLNSRESGWVLLGVYPSLQKHLVTFGIMKTLNFLSICKSPSQTRHKKKVITTLCYKWEL